MKDLLLVIDMQNVYLPGQPWACPSMLRSLENVRTLLKSPRCGRDFDVIFTRYTAARKPAGRWAAYNEAYRDINEDSFLNEIVPQLQPFLAQWPVFQKSTYSSCSIPQIMENVLRYDRILLAGVVAECCILATAEGLIDAGAKVCYLTDAVSGQSEEWEDMIQKIMESFSPIHTEIMTTEVYLKPPVLS